MKHRFSVKTSVFACSAVLAATIMPMAASAQSGGGGAAAVGLEEVLVTARKREETLQDAPITVTAFSAEAIEKRGAQSLDDVARFVPGLSFSKAFGRDTERPVIRALGNVLAGVRFGVESGAAYFIDGIYYPGDVQGLNLQDLERVEVIKGPQSALYGRNTYSGAINFITRPSSEEREGSFKIRYAEHDEHDASFHISGRINEVLRGGLSVRDYQKDGEWTNAVTDREIGDESTWSVSGVLDWDPSDNFHVRLRRIQRRDMDGTRPFFLQPATENNCFPGARSLASWTHSDSDNNFQYFCGAINPGRIALNDRADADGVANLVPGVPNNPLSFTTPYNLADGTPFDGVDRRTNFNSLLAEYDFASGYRIVFTGSYREEERLTGSDSDHASFGVVLNPPAGTFFAISNRSIAHDWSAELRLESPADNALRGTIGVFWYDNYDRDNAIRFNNRQGVFSSESTVENQAVFASIEYDFSEQLTASLEVRSAKETKTQREGTFDGKDDWENFTPRVTVDYQLSDDILLYGVYAQGVKPGGFNGADGAVLGRPTYDQEESDNYELGIKSQWWDNRLQTNLAVFYIDATDIQLTTSLPNPQDALNALVSNQGSGEVFGVELDITALLTPELTLGFTYALADSEFTEGCDEDQWTLTSGGGLYSFSDPSSSSNPNGNGDCSIEGHQFPLSSEHQASLFVDWERTLAGGMTLFAGADVSYESRKYVQVHNEAYVPDATLVGARFGVRWGQSELVVVGTNLSDEDAPILATRWFTTPYFTFLTPNTADPTYNRGAPRAFFAPLREGSQVGIEYRYRF